MRKGFLGFGFLVMGLIIVLGMMGCTSFLPEQIGDYSVISFWFQGADATIVSPAVAKVGNPWIWRARFFGHEPATDLAMLDAGYHLVYVEVGGLYGSPKAVKLWDDFYNFLVTERGLAKHPVLEGMSRGGLIIFNWALANPTLPAAIYADNPVCDFKSWPGGKSEVTKGSLGDWRNCLRAYGYTEEEVMSAPTPASLANKLAEAGIPVILVCGTKDDVVPYSENGQKIYDAYRNVGAPVELILEDKGHHPHGLMDKDPTPIVAFLMRYSDLKNGK